MYVVAIEAESRRVVVGTAAALFGHRVELDEVNWLVDALPSGDECAVQIRYRSAAVPARIARVDGTHLTLDLAEPVRAITPGQSGALYAGTQLLGGGVIAS